MGEKAVFLDRDGVLNQSIVIDGKPFPPRSLGELHILEEAKEGCRHLSAAGFKLICVTNQPDVSRGLMGADELAAINASVMEQLGLDDLRVCHHSDEDNCDCRKPKPGMLLDAAKDHGLDLGQCYMVGDRWRDIDAGRAAGCRTVLIDYHYAERRPDGMDYTCNSLAQAAQFIISGDIAPRIAKSLESPK